MDRTDDVTRRRESSTADRRRGLFIGLLTLLVAAQPLVWAGSLAHSAFSGCWVTCGGDPALTEGALRAIAAAVVLAVPTGVALSTARVRPWAAWVTAVIGIILAVGAWVLFSLDPADADFFVR